MFPPALNTTTNLIELLYLRAQIHPDEPAYTFLSETEDLDISLNYGELVEQVEALAWRLRNNKLQGQRALILYPSNLDFLITFLACLAAEVVAVPAYPPRKNQNMGRIKAIVKDCEPAMVLATTKIMSIARPILAETPEFSHLQYLCTDNKNTEANNAGEITIPDIDSEALAFLQYTSGSTGDPKGVMLSHGNLFYNQKIIHQAGGYLEQARIVSWLPLFHDMGLGIALQAITQGGHCSLMTPATFVQKPQRWLWAISNEQANVSGGPNFGYDHCLKMMKPELYQGLDLSSWKIAFSGAEPVKASTLKAFADVFGSYGFSSRAFMPCYGLAEATVAVTTTVVDAEPRILDLSRKELSENKVKILADENQQVSDAYVGCGKTWLEDELLIVSPDTHRVCQEEEIGEIWLKSKSIGQGFWQKEEINQKIFRAKAAGKPGYYLRTGDLGFMQDHELFVTGRRKDLIIIRGRNYYPQDIENCASQSHEALSRNFVAAVATADQDEPRLVLIHEVERQYLRKLNKNTEFCEEIFAAINTAVSKKIELHVNDIILLRPGRIPKTSSGKIQRRNCLALFLTNQFEAIASWNFQQHTLNNASQKLGQKKTNVEKNNDLKSDNYVAELSTEYLVCYKEITAWLENWICQHERINPSDIDIHEDLASFGMDSVAVMKMSSELSLWLNMELSADILWDYHSIHELAEYLAKIRGSESGEIDAMNAIPVQQRQPGAEYPLSFSQERLWFLEQIGNGTQAYDIEGIYQVKGSLDRDALSLAFAFLVNRHEVFRANFFDRSGDALQTLSDPQWNFENGFCENKNPAASQQYLTDWLVKGRQDKLDLTTGPLLKIRLLEIDNTNHILQVRIHHIISDGWSLSVFVKELAACYEAFAKKTRPALADLSVQYMDYILWQRETMQGAVLNGKLKYWQNKLKGVKSLDIPSANSRPPIQTYVGCHQKFSLSRSMTEELKKLSRKEGVTLYNTLLAAFKILLHKYSGQTDICIGTPMANRTKAGVNEIIGMLVNTLPLRTEITTKDSFLEVLQRVKKTTHEAYKHQEISFSQIIEGLNIPRDLSRSPLFQIMFVMQNSSVSSDFQTSSIELEEIEFETGTAKFDLTMELVEENGVLKGNLEYNTDLFETETMQRLVGHYETLLANVLVEPSIPNNALEIMTTNEREFLYRCNETGKEFAAEVCVHKAFEKQVVKTPENVAIAIGEHTLNYSELNKRANLVCSWLLNKKLAQGSKIGICIGRSINLLPSILGVLKAGCVYVPLDPAFPNARIELMFKEADLVAVLSEEGLLKDSSVTKPKLNINFEDSTFSSLSVANRSIPMTSGSLLYLIFTSGSTGKPKCVAVTHRSAMNLYSWYAEEFAMSQEDKCLIISSVGFDLTHKNLFTPLLVGGQVILPDREEYDAEYLLKTITEKKISWINCAPSAFYPLLETSKQQACLRSLKKVFLGGETIQLDRLKAWLKSSNTELINSYGPSECTDISAYYRLKTADIDKAAPIPIGKANANVQLYVVDKELKQLPVGVPGELFVGGEGVGPGYYNNEALTEEKFVANPFYEAGSGHSMRLYKTGDKVKRLASGDIEFLGRFDHQVKLRGFRIELGEIETVLNSFVEMKESAVKVCTNNHGNSQLVAYYVPVQKMELSSQQIKEKLREVLPDFMVPSAFVKLEKMPLNINGKVDKDALPFFENVESEIAYVAPESETEIKLEKIWVEVLGTEKVGVYDSFFDIGGHSLLATKIVSRAKDTFKVDLAVKALFSMVNIRDMAMYIDTLIKAREDLFDTNDQGGDGRQEIEL